MNFIELFEWYKIFDLNKKIQKNHEFGQPCSSVEIDRYYVTTVPTYLYQNIFCFHKKILNSIILCD